MILRSMEDRKEKKPSQATSVHAVSPDFGSTPAPVLQRLQGRKVDWNKGVQLFSWHLQAHSWPINGMRWHWQGLAISRSTLVSLDTVGSGTPGDLLSSLGPMQSCWKAEAGQGALEG